MGSDGLAKSSGVRGVREVGPELSGLLVTVHDPGGVAAEAFRLLRTNLLYAFVDNPPEVVMLTSPGPGEGKSVAAANLAVTLAHGGKNTLVVDCDLRRPAMHHLFGGAGETGGLVNVLAGERVLREVAHEPIPGLKVVAAGPATSNPAELLNSERMAGFLRAAREEFDYVLLDAPAVGMVSDPVILATRVDGVLMVLDAHDTRKAALGRAIRGLTAVGGNVLGVVMNKVESGPALDGNGAGRRGPR